MIDIGNDGPGENIEVVHRGGKRIFLRHERRGNERCPWSYWAFHADGLPAGEVVFRFTDGTIGAGGKTVAPSDPPYRYDAEVVGPFGPAISLDGVHWTWLGAEAAPDRRSFKYANTAGHKRVHFSIYPGYRPRNLDLFVRRHAKHPRFRTSILTVSENGADIPLLEIGDPQARYHVLLTARHHAGETTANYVLEGFLSHMLAGRGFAAENFLFHVVPFVDYDGVVAGDPGNNRLPHNHNRDYGDAPIFAAVRAIQAMADAVAFSAALDFHGPLKWGGTNDVAHAVKTDPSFEGADVYWAIMREKFGAIGRRGQIPVLHDLIFPEYNGDTPEGILAQNRRMCSGYMRFRKGLSLAISLETPYCGTPTTFTVAAENLRSLGRRYARGLDEYARLFMPLRMCRWKNLTKMTYTGIVKPPLDFSRIR